MPIITPYNELQGNKTSGGTWAYIGTSGSYPTPPATYNGTMDTTSFANGSYPYSYTVTLSGKTDVKNFNLVLGTKSPRVNELCDNATLLPFTKITDRYVSDELYNDERCPGLLAPVASGVTLPGVWSSIFPSWSGDLWYKIAMNPISVEEQGTIFITVDSSEYSTPMINPGIAVYISCGGTLYDAAVGTDTNASVAITLTSTTYQQFYIRIASPIGYEGSFKLTIST